MNAPSKGSASPAGSAAKLGFAIAWLVVMILGVAAFAGAPIVTMLIAGRPSRVWDLAVLALAATIAVPVLFAGITIILGQRRQWLARGFRAVVVGSLLATVGLLWFEAGLMIAALSVLFQRQELDLQTLISLYACLGFAAAIAIASVAIVSQLPRLFAVDAIRITGVKAGPDRMPALVDRVEALAKTLGATPPTSVVIGLEPLAFVARTPLELRGIGLQADAESLYLSVALLRVLDDSEIDAVIAHELGHFRGQDLVYSLRFVPASMAFRRVLAEMTTESEAAAVGAQIWRMPAGLCLLAMAVVTRRVVARIARARELEADRAATEVAPPSAMISALLKLSALQFFWRVAGRTINDRAVSNGRARANSCADLLAFLRAMLDDTARRNSLDVVMASGTTHPFDRHPSIVDRAKALGVDVKPLTQAALSRLRDPTVHDGDLAIVEEEITRIQTEYARIPGQTLSPDTETVDARIARLRAEAAAPEGATPATQAVKEE